MLLVGCAGVQSGHYVQLRSGESLTSLSRELAVEAEQIKKYNPMLRFESGEWVFIPLKRGFWSASSRDQWVAAQYATRLKLLWPVPSSRVVSSGFGPRWRKKHHGIDIKAREGASIVAAEQGKVIYSGSRLRGFGKMVVIRHAHGLYTLYAHNQRNLVGVNQYVQRGQVVGRVGHTGRSTGNHLHFEIRMGDEAINPLVFFQGASYRGYALR